MELIDEEELKKAKKKTHKTKNVLFISIIILLLLTAILISTIIYFTYDPNRKTLTVDGVQNAELLGMLDIVESETEGTEIYVPIRRASEQFGFKSYEGGYLDTSNDSNQCYVETTNKEIIMYKLDSNTIIKINEKNEYEYYDAQSKVFKNNGELFVNIEDLTNVYNLIYEYNEKERTISIYTLDYLIATYKTLVTAKYGYTEIDIGDTNQKTILEDLMIVKDDEGKEGIIKISTGEKITDNKYDYMQYLEEISAFIVKINNKLGLITSDGKTKINCKYEELTLIEPTEKIFVAQYGDLYGTVNIDGNEVIKIVYDNIGIDISAFKENNVKSGYVLLNKLIPVQKEGMWAFFDLKGNQITDFEYDDIGCAIGNSKNAYSLLQIEEYDVIIVKQNEKYNFMDISGNDEILPFVFDSIYIKDIGGEKSYKMIYNDKEYDVVKYLENRGVTKKES